VIHDFPSRFFSCAILFLGCVFLGPTAIQAETEVDLLAEPQTSMRGGSTLVASQSAEGGVVLTINYPQGEGGGGHVTLKVDAFEGPLSHITFNAKGTLGYGRIGVRGSTKQGGSVGMDLPVINDGMQSYSLDFTAAIQAAEAGGEEFAYPITGIIIGFRYKENPEDIVEISDLVLHAAD